MSTLRRKTPKVAKPAKGKRVWLVHATVVGGKHIGEFEAATGEEAIKLALGSYEGGGCSVCHQCSSEISDPEFSKVTAEAQKPDGSWETVEEEL